MEHRFKSKIFENIFQKTFFKYIFRRKKKLGNKLEYSFDVKVCQESISDVFRTILALSPCLLSKLCKFEVSVFFSEHSNNAGSLDMFHSIDLQISTKLMGMNGLNQDAGHDQFYLPPLP